MMDHITHKDGGRVARAGMDHDITRGMAGGAFEPEPIFKGVVVVNQFRLPSAYHRQHAVLKSATVRRVFAALVYPLPVGEFAAGHDVAGIWEGRDPAPIVEPGVPADMVPVQMRAHHIIDILGLDPYRREVSEIRRAHPMKLRPCRALLVVAETGVDQNRVL